MPRVLKLYVTQEQLDVIRAAALLAPDPERDDLNPNHIDRWQAQALLTWWLVEQLTAACQARIDEVKAAAKASKT